MNAILQFCVMPWERSALGIVSYGVLTEWLDPRSRSVTPGSDPVRVFRKSDDAKQYAREQVAAWPYRADAYYLNGDKSVPLI